MLKIASVRNTSSPSTEYVQFIVTKNCYLDDFMIIDHTYDSDSHKSNKSRNTYIFPRDWVLEGEIIFLNTGVGTNDNPSEIRSKNPLKGYYDYYWGLSRCVWNNTGDVATVLRISKVDSKNV